MIGIVGAGSSPLYGDIRLILCSQLVPINFQQVNLLQLCRESLNLDLT